MIRDDRQDPQRARQAFRELKQAGVQAVIGPMTSTVALSLVPLAEAEALVLISGTVSTTKLSGKDDHFFRVIGDTALAAGTNARFHAGRLGY